MSRDASDSICYFVVCFDSVEFVAFLLSSIYTASDLFLVHIDPKSPAALKDFLREISNKYENIILELSRPYSWAGFSHVDITMAAMKRAYKIQSRWTHFIALSEQHLPLKSPNEVAIFLRSKRSMINIRSATVMGGEERHDIENRFGARYQELPGVGCFATGLSNSIQLLEDVYHGTNWFALHRVDCELLFDAFERGLFEAYRHVVHPEETAIQSILVQAGAKIESQDVTLVAVPAITDNHSLIMTDKLFAEATESEFLFIRKRQRELSNFTRMSILSRNFESGIYEIFQRQTAFPEVADVPPSLSPILNAMLSSRCSGVHIYSVDPQTFRPTPRLHIVLEPEDLKEYGIKVRLLSENCVDFKVLIDKAQEFPKFFEKPYEKSGYLHSTIRARVYGLAGHLEILPLAEIGGGFFSVDGKSFALIIDTVLRFLESAYVYARSSSADDALVSKSRPVGYQTNGTRADMDKIRSDRLNALSTINGAKRYLEIGVCHGETFFEVDVPFKVGVDPNFRFDYKAKISREEQFYLCSSDEYFLGVEDQPPFDLIYLDGLHTYEQTLRDLINSFSLSHANTIWLVDDTVPTNVFASLPDQLECWESRKKLGLHDWSWMGDVYKVVFFVAKMMPFINYRTYSEHGQTVLWRTRNDRRKICENIVAVGDIGQMTYADMIRCLDVMRITSDPEILSSIGSELQT